MCFPLPSVSRTGDPNQGGHKMGIYKKGKSRYVNFYYQGQRFQECVGQVSRAIAKEILVKRKAEVIAGVTR